MNKDIYQHRRHNKNLLMVHLIFVTRYRKKLFYGANSEMISNSIFLTSARHIIGISGA